MGARMRLSGLPVLCAAALIAASSAQLPPGVPDVVTFEAGSVLGVRSDTAGVRYFLGVPYAAPTNVSWLPPAPRQPWNGTLNGTAYGPGCIQSHHNADVPHVQSFDCLLLNVFAPLSTPSPASVMVFLHGGAYQEGSSQGPFGMYSGARVAAEGVVVVTVQYRLGVFGWLYLDGVGSNYGLQDQVAALQWVQKNIAAVGGDPTRVTIWGESAGAMSIGALLVSPHAEGLFSRAIMESNVGGFNYKNTSEAAVYGSTFCGLLNCSSGAVGAASPKGLAGSSCHLPCLQAAAQANPGTVMKAWDTATNDVPDFIFVNLRHILDGLLGTTPVVDGDWLPVEPLSAVEGGTYWGAKKKVAVLLGTNSNEGETFIYGGLNFPLPAFLAPAAYYGLFGFNESNAAAVDVQPRYSSKDFPEMRPPLSNVVTDYWFRCASQRFAAGAVAAGAPAFVYRFDHLYSNASIFPAFGLPPICATAVCHASELPFVFDELPSFASFTPEEQTFSQSILAYWTSFAKTGDPNAGKAPAAPQWPSWDPVGRDGLVLNLTITQESSAELCGFWDGLGYFF